MSTVYVVTCKKCGYMCYSTKPVEICPRHRHENVPHCDGEVMCETPREEYRRRIREGKELAHEKLVREAGERLKVQKSRKERRRLNKMLRVYISGPIAGTSDYIKRFEEAEDDLKEQGYAVINPARICSSMPKDTTEDEYMELCTVLLGLCDKMYVLKNWEQSDGVREELKKARDWDIPTEFERKAG